MFIVYKAIVKYTPKASTDVYTRSLRAYISNPLHNYKILPQIIANPNTSYFTHLSHKEEYTKFNTWHQINT